MISVLKLETKGWAPTCELCVKDRAPYALCEGYVPKLWVCGECMRELKKVFGEWEGEGE